MGAKTLKKSLVLSTSGGGQDPQKVIDFDNFVYRKMPIFSLFHSKLGRANWGGGQDKILLHPLATPSAATTGYSAKSCGIIQVFFFL